MNFVRRLWGDFIFYKFSAANILRSLNKLDYPFVEELRVKSENFRESTCYEITGRGIPVLDALKIVQKDSGEIIDNRMFYDDLILNNLKRIEFYERSVDFSRGKLPQHKYVEVIFTIE